MMQGRDFIITSLQPLSIAIGSTIKNTAFEISNKNRVIYLNSPIDYLSALKKKFSFFKKKKIKIRKVNDNFYVVDCQFYVFPVGRISNTWLFDYLNKRNNKKIGKYLLSVIKELKVENFIHLIDTDIYRSQYLKDIISPAVSIYYCRDFVIGAPYWKYNGKRLEDKLAKKSDIVLTNSTYFQERFSSLNPNTHAIETGVDLSLYDHAIKREIPADLKNIKAPIIGYVGVLTGMRLNADLLYDVAKICKEYSFVFVGPEDGYFVSHKLHTLDNVYFLGSKKVEELPNYITFFDVCINPQLINDITIGNYPLKIDEYLAMGKPVVATETHTMNDIFKDYVHLATNADEYVYAINKALDECDDEELAKQRVAFAHTHSWTNSVNKIYGFIKGYESKSLR